jgi:hypothetical protein
MTDDDKAELMQVVDAADTAMRALGWMATRTIVLAEIIDEDGERQVVMAPSRDIRAQDSFGLLDYALARERAGVAREVLGEEEP